MKNKCLKLITQAFQSKNYIFLLHAIDLHFSAIDCTLQTFRSFTYVSLCNRFTLLVQSIAYLKFSKRFASVSQCNRFTLFVQSIVLTYFFLLTSHAIDLHC